MNTTRISPSGISATLGLTRSARFIQPLLEMRLLRRVPPHMWVAATAWGSGLIGAVGTLFSMRLLTVALGEDGYAAFVILSGLMGWFLLLNFGLGNSLQNEIAALRAQQKPFDDQVVTAVAFVALLVGLAIIISLAFGPEASAALLHQCTSVPLASRIATFNLIAFSFSLMALGHLGLRICYAQLLGYWANLCSAASAIVALTCTVLLTKLSANPPLEWCVLVQTLPLALLSLTLVLWITLRAVVRGGRLVPRLMPQILARSVPFWLLALMSMGVLGVDYLVLSHFLKPREVVVYNVVARLSGFALFLYTAVLTSLWPSLAEAINANQWGAVRQHLYRHLGAGLVCAALCGSFFTMGKSWVIALVAPNYASAVPFSLVALFGVYLCIRVWTDTFSTTLLALNKTSLLLYVVPAQALISLSLQCLLVYYFGVYGAILGVMGSFVATVVWMLPLVVFREIRSRENASAS